MFDMVYSVHRHCVRCIICRRNICQAGFLQSILRILIIIRIVYRSKCVRRRI